ncbi:UDP-N-acetyl-D-mannosamine dehydrogenase [Bordetella genomosp. 7]|uniref:NDP-N-acetyl-D-galactosaminuronic acid dehydrogenase n=1 Tax=Bordetella genomosp. 7 TaxID=1416805 RepID=A0A261RCF1_9BORD|nr:MULTISPECIES: UDP-N-acetyl-D-mannosamine dehydrogenase [Bordetella]OZI22457.1 UDP-N-acetyl-D-mannosamine dehydrogenase [Bordetella genomosp. 7]OZI26952.1 UDP-N-acetyl-D-mannosamine dehydrogenase [Bordetella genomosp. 7]
MNDNSTQTVSVIGLGYIGLPTAAMIASRKVKVIGVDINQHAVDTINRGRIHIIEPGLERIVQSVVSEGYLRATTKPEPADAFLIAVPTPFKDDHEPDVSYIRAAVEAIAPVLNTGNIIILESTSPVGTTEQMVQWLSELRPDLKLPLQGSVESDVYVAYCPERVLPGQVVRELVENDRIVGGINHISAQKAKSVYQIFVQGQLLETNARTAEMSKLTENAFRDVNIAFANELSLICDKLDINVWELIQLANHHPRVNILQPGAGVGGHCIAVDPWFIVSKTPEQARITRTAREVNDGKPDWVAAQILAAIHSKVVAGQDEEDVTVALLGLAFKPDIDDLRESPAMHIAERLHAKTRARILLCEPYIEEKPANLAGELVSPEAAVERADVVALLVKHSPFKEVDFSRYEDKVVIDAVGLLHK